uniref:Uncharacterized protein n=1 Tax=Anguilla anguilla TaxID=7936 RepID=A0A0E9TA42_ANGAN
MSCSSYQNIVLSQIQSCVPVQPIM